MPITNEPMMLDERTQANLEILRQIKRGDFSKAKAYTGFGGLRQMFKLETMQTELEKILSLHERDALFKSTRTGYFTPLILIDFIYAVLGKLGFKQGKILEPACGHGAFFERMPKHMREKSTLTGIELEPLSARIAKALYLDVRILNRGFHHFHETGFDLILGNPPYAPFGVYDQKHPDLKDVMIHHYFVAKSARLLKPGGLLAMVLPSYVLDNVKRHVRDQLAEAVDLVAAFRMPETLFVDAKVTVDVVIFQRTQAPKKDWNKLALAQLSDHTSFRMIQYFVQHPEHVLGVLETYEGYSHFEDKPRKALCCQGSFEEVQAKLPSLLENITPLATLMT